jgi:hypothetical protein
LALVGFLVAAGFAFAGILLLMFCCCDSQLSVAEVVDQ